MNTYQWTTNQIDEMDFFDIQNLVFSEAKKEEKVQYIDQVFGT